MPSIQTIISEDIHTGIMFIGGCLYVLLLLLIALYHSIVSMFKR